MYFYILDTYLGFVYHISINELKILNLTTVVIKFDSIMTIFQILQEDVISKVLSRCNNDEVVPLIGLYDEDIVLKSKKVITTEK